VLLLSRSASLGKPGTSISPSIPAPADRALTWSVWLIGYLLYASVLLRALLYYAGRPGLGGVALLLGAYLLLYASLSPLAGRARWYPAPYLALQTLVVMALLLQPQFQDFFAILFAGLGAQAVQHVTPRRVVAWLGLFAALTLAALLRHWDPGRALAATAVYLAVSAFVAWHALTCERARSARLRNQALLSELRQANQQLQAYAAHLEHLAVTRERSRLARELHDSVTQTIFSLTLTAKSAALLLERDPAQVGTQLERLEFLTANALGELRSLVAHLRPATVSEEGFVCAVRRHLAARYLQDGLAVRLAADEAGSLAPVEAENLFRIVQEALNNVVKHARCGEAVLQIHLGPAAWVEVRDRGQGFCASSAPAGGHLGLATMRERAQEIGWRLDVTSAPGAGTCVRVEKLSQEVVA
jgi:signal transduction histidine kinase